MEVVQNKDTLIITSNPEYGYKFIHVVFDVSRNLIEYSNITENDSLYEGLSDGYSKIYEIKLPTSPTNNEGEYYIQENKVYNWEKEEVSITSLLNLEELYIKNIFSTHKLKQCYISLYKDNLMRCDSCDYSKRDTTFPDTLFMGLEVINYLLELNLRNDADMILGYLERCGVCR